MAGCTALTTVAAWGPEVILCDIGLPGMSGWEVARALGTHRSRSQMRLVALTGYAAPEDERRAQESGFDRFLAKPAELSKLEALLAELPAGAPATDTAADP